MIIAGLNGPQKARPPWVKHLLQEFIYSMASKASKLPLLTKPTLMYKGMNRTGIARCKNRLYLRKKSFFARFFAHKTRREDIQRNKFKDQNIFTRYRPKNDKEKTQVYAKFSSFFSLQNSIFRCYFYQTEAKLRDFSCYEKGVQTYACSMWKNLGKWSVHINIILYTYIVYRCHLVQT